eukprot:2416570-Pyramimonas_sp.AAC.2
MMRRAAPFASGLLEALHATFHVQSVLRSPAQSRAALFCAVLSPVLHCTTVPLYPFPSGHNAQRRLHPLHLPSALYRCTAVPLYLVPSGLCIPPL